MIARTEFRVVAERDGRQWPIPNQHDEPIIDRGAAEAYRNYVELQQPTFDRVFIVHAVTARSAWVDDRGVEWNEQAALDESLLELNERRYA
ncbi:hypothetical protein [Tenggerimyces flavus]|uniref:Transposase n=1 Tax=Tenggerimyces flavus TaxID=1708749 RepID=A0ABV7YD93_9ACTN|nr:hypothetical protein [Tenggerimyces flavus]MBM7788869.1 hypothetical protein [Tenggerimyces flavus]